ncbi:FHA domain-containing protein [Nocardia brasiliensis]|uniref:FHA domain-containing protein n=2 Tax=Nocardia brasiliensis TaxID=37326 RepID=A0A6G9Y2P5_NOCBR|nr:FHA domain-containing protein [Nocardia brasiliensis]
MPPAGGGDGSAQGGAPQDIVAADERPTSYPPSAGGGERGVQGDSGPQDAVAADEGPTSYPPSAGGGERGDSGGPQDSVAADEPVSQRPSASVTPPRLVKPSAQSQTGPQDQLGSGPVRFGGAVSEIDLQETVVPTSARTPHRAEVESRGPGVVVKGFKCARDHLNDPRVSFCAVCGIRMDQLTCVLTDGVRPPLGLLLLDDGTSFVLDSDCVLGREPEHAPAVARGAHPVRLEDRSGGMSRAHAEIRLVDWDVTVVDGGSTNGTHIRQPGHQDWSRAIPGHPVKLIPGAQVQLGSRTVTFDSQHGQL